MERVFLGLPLFLVTFLIPSPSPSVTSTSLCELSLDMNGGENS